MAWDFAAGIGSSILGGLFSNAASKKQYKYQSALQEQAARLNYEYGLKSLENSPTSQRKGLETAGYNPMLAVQNATSGSNTGWTTTGQAQNVDYSQSMSNVLDFQRVKNETAQTDSTVKLQGEQAQTEQAKRQNLDFQNAMLDVEKHLKQKDLDTYDQRFYTEIYQMMQNAEKLRQEASVVGYNAESSRIIANAQKQQAQNESVSNPFKYAHDTVRRHLKSFEKDHPILSKTPQFRSLTNFVQY